MHNKPLPLRCSYTTLFSSSGSLLVTLGRDVVGWDVEGRVRRFRARPLPHPSHCAIHPDELQLVIKNTAGRIALLDAHDGRLVQVLDACRDNEGSNLVYSRCGAYLVDGSWNGQVTVRSATSGEIVFQKAFPGEMIQSVARSSCGERWFIVHQPKVEGDANWPKPAYVSVWSWPFIAPVDILMPPGRTIDALCVSPDARRLCLAGDEGITLIDLAEKRISARFPFTPGSAAAQVKWSPDGREMATVQDDCFVFYDLTTGAVNRTIAMQYASDVAYSPDGSLIAMGAWEKGLLIPTESRP